MKITLSVNLGGYSFNIDEDAYAELKRYLKNLELHFAGEESASEILSDIETRMAELFRAKMTGFKPENSNDPEAPEKIEEFSDKMDLWKESLKGLAEEKSFITKIEDLKIRFRNFGISRQPQLVILGYK